MKPDGHPARLLVSEVRLTAVYESHQKDRGTGLCLLLHIRRPLGRHLCSWLIAQSRLFLLFLFKSFFQLFQALGEGFSRAGEVDAEEAFPFFSEDVSLVEPEVAVVEYLVFQCFSSEMIVSHVEPDEVGAFRFDEFHLWDVLQEFSREGKVALDIGLHQGESFFSAPVGRFCGCKTQDVQLVVAEGVQFIFEFLPDFRIGDPDVGVLESGDVECFGRGGADDAVSFRLFS